MSWPIFFPSAGDDGSLFTSLHLTTVEIAALVAPSEGMVVFNTDLNEYQIYDGTQWHCMAERSPTNANYTSFVDATNRVEWWASSLRRGFISAGQLWIDSPAQFKKQVVLGPNLTIDSSAALQVDSTTQGVLFPRMTTVQRDAIGTPAAGLVIYNTTTAKLNVFTTAWEAITSV